MAHKKGGGTTKNNRDSKPKNLGLKKQSGNLIKNGNIILRQHGQIFKSGINTSLSKDFTIFALSTGFLFFNKKHLNIKPYL